ncbi:MAG: superoxide dismutase family protein [Sphingobium sp.]
MKIGSAFALLTPLFLASACTSGGTSSAGSAATPAPMAKAMLSAGDGAARGEATMSEVPGGLSVKVMAVGVSPGTHAVHIHTTGACAGPDFTSAGGHWNPAAHQHGRDNPAGMHMGDLPNMVVGANGVGEIEYLVPGGVLNGGAMPLFDADGAAIVIHAQADDYKTDPTGNAGGRIACGVLAPG